MYSALPPFIIHSALNMLAADDEIAVYTMNSHTFTFVYNSGVTIKNPEMGRELSPGILSGPLEFAFLEFLLARG